jgi:hypothetical protein
MGPLIFMVICTSGESKINTHKPYKRTNKKGINGGASPHL